MVGATIRMTCGLGLLAALLATGGPAAQPHGLPNDLGSVLIQSGQFTYDDLSALEQGRVVTRTVARPQDLEASVTTGVRILTTLDRAVTYFQQLVSYVDGQVTKGYGTFSRPPSDSDLARLTPDSATVADVRACRADACEVRAGAATPAEIASGVDWSAADASNRAATWMRRAILAYAADYLVRGDAALKGHDEKGAAIDLPDLWRVMLGRSPTSALAPALHRYISAFPSAPRPDGLTETLYWDQQHYTSLKPIIGLTHMLSWRDSDRPGRFVIVQRQFFADHYLYGSLGVTIFFQDPAATPPATYVLYFNRTRGDLLKGTQPPPAGGLRARISGIGASIQRRVGEELIKQSAERLLTSMKQALEGTP